ncbi:hypothetical protein SAMN02799622_02028 [Methylobacterium sp. UNC378MF]|nr:hypothetical protein SAMN02799622_02028 [Methylobacterium sp. UNC378MF]
MTTSAERRARRRWQMGASEDPIEAAGKRLADLADRIMDMHRTTEAVAAKLEAGSGSPAELEAVTRWAVAAGSAYARAAEDLRRLNDRLNHVAGLVQTQGEPA